MNEYKNSDANELDVGRLSVIDDSKLVGIIDRIDALQACLS